MSQKNILGSCAYSSEVASELYASCAELAKLKIPGYPASERGWLDVVKRDSYPFREVRAQGGKRGVKREYLPPPEVQALIAAVRRGEVPPAAPRAAAAKPLDQAPVNSPVPAINIDALVQSVCVMQQNAPKGETLAQSVRKGIEFYLYCIDRNLVTPEGQGEGDLDQVA